MITRGCFRAALASARQLRSGLAPQPKRKLGEKAQEIAVETSAGERWVEWSNLWFYPAPH